MNNMIVPNRFFHKIRDEDRVMMRCVCEPFLKMWDVEGGFLARSIRCYCWSRRKDGVSDNDGQSSSLTAWELI